MGPLEPIISSVCEIGAIEARAGDLRGRHDIDGWDGSLLNWLSWDAVRYDGLASHEP